MSVELRIVCDRPEGCTAGIPKPIGFTDHCHHRLECDWGVLNNAEADPRHGLEHLMLITGDTVTRLLTEGPEACYRGDAIVSATCDSGRLFIHLDGESSATWELFESHFWDGGGPEGLMIGRWPD